MSGVGIYGGAFDPIHIGHLITAQLVKESRNLSKIIFIPSRVSPHKMNVQLSEAEHRLNMLMLAIKGVPHFDYSEIELEREGVSYTIDTLREFRKKYEHMELIIGYDNIFKFDTWKEPNEILNLAKLIVLRRKLNIPRGKQNKYYRAAVFLKTPFIQISGSIIRKRIQEGLPINFMVPDNVRDYIQNFSLYKD
jgi:nicotinate-nucleotide adenylyltransferase